jgi:hypothetical protein
MGVGGSGDARDGLLDGNEGGDEDEAEGGVSKSGEEFERAGVIFDVGPLEFDRVNPFVEGRVGSGGSDEGARRAKRFASGPPGVPGLPFTLFLI